MTDIHPPLNPVLLVIVGSVASVVVPSRQDRPLDGTSRGTLLPVETVR
jgi:hypothetical protein